jgi:hypothetical protein
MSSTNGSTPELYSYDLFTPAGSGSKVLDVGVDYCAITSSEEIFLSTKTHFFAEGKYDLVKNYGYTNGIKSLAFYKKRAGLLCQKGDVPIMYDGNRSRFFPILADRIPNIASNGTISSFSLNAFSYLLAIRPGKSFYVDNNQFQVGGSDQGFVRIARYLSVPACYKVTVNGTGNTSSKTYYQGEYDLKANFTKVQNVSLSINHDCQVRKNSVTQAGGMIKQTTSGLCFTPADGSTNPDNHTGIILIKNCVRSPVNTFRMLGDGSIQHVASGKCLHPSGGSPTPGNQTSLVLYEGCGEDRLKFNFTNGNSIQHLTGGKCLHPNNGSATPTPGTGMVFYSGCNENRLQFSFTNF